MTSFRLRIMAQVLPFLLVAPVLAPAQTPPSRSEAMTAMKAGSQHAQGQYTKQQIDQLLAPIALYPDQLLAQVLMAATYPQQLLEAADWLQDPQHAALKGDALAQALADLQWDPSVKALVAFPQILLMMTDHLEWTESLGLAFATQQAEVMSRVQALRQLAVKSGRLDKMKHVTVRKEANVIMIVSAEPDRVVVPVYNPTVVYGQWPDPDYPPVYVTPPRRFVAETHETVFQTVEPGLEIVSYPVVQPLWGWARPDWRSERITIETREYTRITRGVRPPPNNVWHREGPIVIVSPSVLPPPPAVAVPAGAVAPRQAVAVTGLQERAASHSDRVRVETSAPARHATSPQNAAGASQPGAPTTGGSNAETRTSGQERGAATPGEAPSGAAHGNREAAGKGQPATAGATSAGGEQAGKPQPENAPAQTGQAQTGQAQTRQSQTGQTQTGKPPAQQPQTGQAQQPQSGKERAQQSQTEKSPAQHSQAGKERAQQPQLGTTQGQPSQAERPQTQHPREAQHPQTGHTQTGQAQTGQTQTGQAQTRQSQSERPQVQHPQTERTQAQQPQSERPQTRQSQTERPQAQHPQAERSQAQQPQAREPQTDRGQAAAKAQADKARAEKSEAERARANSHGAATATPPAAAGQNQAAPAPGRRPGTAGEAHGMGTSGPPREGHGQGAAGPAGPAVSPHAQQPGAARPQNE